MSRLSGVEASAYTDLGALAELKARARARDPAAARAAARQVEAMFLQLMLRSMRQASGEDPLFSSEQMRLYRDLFDRQIAIELATRGGLGLAEMLERRLGGPGAPAAEGGPAGALRGTVSAPPRSRARPAEAADPIALPGRAPASRPAGEAAGPPPPAARCAMPGPGTDGLAPPAGERCRSASRPAARAEPRPAEATGGPWEQGGPRDPVEFVAAVLPEARRAARALGVDPALLVAQAALESGWGRAVIRTREGTSSHNLFGIKADGGWDGPRVYKATLEYRDGAMVRVWAPFRVYPSIAASFDDYVRLVSTSPRYAAARGAAEPRAYLEALAAGGYATDPGYPEKVLGALERVKATRSL